MKKTCALLICFFLISLSVLPAQSTGTIKLSFKYSTTNIEKGYDHLSRLKVYINGQLLGVSSEKRESKPNKITIQLAPGNYLVRAVLEANYKGRWEEHTVTNRYNTNCLFESPMKVTDNLTITLLFDLNKGTVVRSNSK